MIGVRWTNCLRWWLKPGLQTASKSQTKQETTNRTEKVATPPHGAQQLGDKGINPSIQLGSKRCVSWWETGEHNPRLTRNKLKFVTLHVQNKASSKWKWLINRQQHHQSENKAGIQGMGLDCVATQGIVPCRFPGWWDPLQSKQKETCQTLTLEELNNCFSDELFKS